MGRARAMWVVVTRQSRMRKEASLRLRGEREGCELLRGCGGVRCATITRRGGQEVEGES